MTNQDNVQTAEQQSDSSVPPRAAYNRDLIEERISNIITDAGFKVLRKKSTNEPLNVSYTEDGLRWTVNRDYRLLYYKEAYLKHRVVDGQVSWYIEGDTTPADNVWVQDFVPMNHFYPNEKLNRRMQGKEINMVDRALRMLYQIPEYVQNQTVTEQVWTSTSTGEYEDDDYED